MKTRRDDNGKMMERRRWKNDRNPMETHREPVKTWWRTGGEPVENRWRTGGKQIENQGGGRWKERHSTQHYCFSILYFYCDRCTIIRLVSLDF